VSVVEDPERKFFKKKNDDVHNSGVAAISPATMPK
jgi:hypothetical protein